MADRRPTQRPVKVHRNYSAGGVRIVRESICGGIIGPASTTIRATAQFGSARLLRVLVRALEQQLDATLKPKAGEARA
jgi:hypothetical protein